MLSRQNKVSIEKCLEQKYISLANGKGCIIRHTPKITIMQTVKLVITSD